SSSSSDISSRALDRTSRRWSPRTISNLPPPEARTTQLGRPMSPISYLRRLLVVLHGGPQPVFVQPEHIGLGLLAGARGDHRPALLVHVEHQELSLVLRVPEELLE